MRKLIIGHRGVGKTAFLKRHAEYCMKKNIAVKHFDLDLVIEQQIGLSINKIFETNGEKFFRETEALTLNKIMAENHTFVISLGAGFTLQKLPKHTQILFITRVTDAAGRIFLDRPRLNLKKSALEEYQERFPLRQAEYFKYSSEIYQMPEGLTEANAVESKVVLKDFSITDAYYTLSANEISQIEKLKINFKKIELRTDILSNENIESLVQADEKFPWLISYRNENTPQIKNVRIDYDCSVENRFKEQAKDSETVISCHDENLQSGIENLAKHKGMHLKLSPKVESFADLWTGHLWQQEDELKRSFLPRSTDGKWAWYREICKYTQKINFIRNYTDMQDQPSPYQWLRLPTKKPLFFGAVLGQPVHFSRSPLFHEKFMSAQKSFFTAISISEPELQEFHPWLQTLGLRYAAITSPLKKCAYQISDRTSELAEKFHATNTLVFQHNQIYSQNTDAVGFKSLIEFAGINQSGKIAIWGGGGTLSMMKSVLPEATFFSSRTATLRDHELIEDDGFLPDVLIWSAPRSPDTKWPVSNWQPKLVIDLGYQENSMGLEYAQKLNCKYISGLVMFEAQAEQQQHYWSQI